MPFTGFSYFYDRSIWYYKIDSRLFQCPSRAFLISTLSGEMEGIARKLVSMPFTGFSSFSSNLRHPLSTLPSRTRFCRYFSEYSHKSRIPGNFWHVHTLFIFQLFQLYCQCTLDTLSFKILYLIFADQKSTSDNYFLSLY